jgi:hypothetical protein
MILGHLYTFVRWPESIPNYRLGFNQHFLYGWAKAAGFDKHPYCFGTRFGQIHYEDRVTNGMSIRVPCLPLESAHGN